MKHPLLIDAGGRLSGACPDGVVPFWNEGPADRRRVIAGTEAKLVVPNQVPEMRL